LRLQDFSVHFVPAVDTWNWIMNVVRLDEAKKKFVDNHPENPHINYLRNPVSGVRELERLMDVLETILPKIKIPTLVVQSNKDPVVDPKGAERIFRLLGAEDKKLVMYNFPRHGILLGEGAHRVHRTIGQFIDQGLEAAGIVARGFGVMDGTGSGDHDQTVVLTVQDALHGAARLYHRLSGAIGHRDLRQQLSRGDDLLQGGDA
jgi:alpha-beta hydrolase superfamily lysophospholipase